MKTIRKCLLLLVTILLACGVTRAVQAAENNNVEVYANGELLGSYENMMDAFAVMTDASKDYTIKLISADARYYIDGNFTWPAVNSITVQGDFQYVYMGGSQTLNCDVTLSYLHMVQDDVALDTVFDIQGNTLTMDRQSTLGGELYSFSELTTSGKLMEVIGGDGSVIEVTGGDFAEFFCNMDVERVVAKSGDVHFRGTNAVYNVDYVDVYDGVVQLLGVTFNNASYGGQTVNIGKLSILGNNVNVSIFVEDVSRLVIDEVYATKAESQVCFVYIQYMGLATKSDITITGELTNITQIVVQIDGYIFGDGKIQEELKLDNIVYAPRFTGTGRGTYYVNYYSDDNIYRGYETGEFLLKQVDGNVCVDKNSFEVSYDNRIYYCGDYQYSLNNNGEAIITSYSGTELNLVIPEELDGHKVTEIKEIGYNIINLETITLPAALEKIDRIAFSMPDNDAVGYKLSAIRVAEGNTHFKSIDGVLYSYDETILYRCPCQKDSITIPDTVKEIEDYAFQKCINIRYMVIPDSVEHVGGRAFTECKALEYVKLSKNQNAISQAAFYRCTNLKEVIVTSTDDQFYVGQDAFSECKSLKSIYIGGKTYCSLDSTSFLNCQNLENIILLADKISYGVTEDQAHEAYTGCAYNFKMFCKLGTDTEDVIKNVVKVNYGDVSEVNPFVIYEEKLALNMGDTYYMPVYRNPYEAQDITWTSSNEQIATVSAEGIITAVGAGEVTITAASGENTASSVVTVKGIDATVSTSGIYVMELNRNGFFAGMVAEATNGADIQYRWTAYNKGTQEEILIQDWTDNNQWVSWTPDSFGEYVVTAEARVKYNPASIVTAQTEAFEYNPHIKGKCQMPWWGEGGGYLIGVESYENPNQSYQYEMLILDCTLLAEGKPAWVYTTNKFTVTEGAAGWCVWQPEYGYYWTLFRVYDAEGNMIDQACYPFVNAY